MLKGLGCVLLLGCAAAVQVQTVRADRRELELLASLCAALRQMDSEIKLNLTPLPQLFQRMARLGPPPLQGFFGGLERDLRGGADLSGAWRRGVPALGLEGEALQGLLDLELTGDEETVRANLALAEGRLAAALEEKRRLRAGREKLSASLSFSAALLLILLLI